MKSRNLLLKHEAGVGALLAITDNSAKQQVVIRLVPYGEEHVTIHRKPDGSLLKTHAWNEKPASTWDKARIAAAAKVGYKNPTKHADYTVHEPLRDEPYLWDFGDHVVGRRIDLAELSPKQKYIRNAVTVAAPESPFMLDIYFSRGQQPVADHPELLWELETSLGWLYIRHSRPTRLSA